MTDAQIEEMGKKLDDLHNQVLWIKENDTKSGGTMPEKNPDPRRVNLRDLERHIEHLERRIDGVSEHTAKRIRDVEKQLADMTRDEDTLTIGMTLVSGDTATVQFSDGHMLKMAQKEYEAIIAEGKAQGETTPDAKLEVKEGVNND